MSPRRSSSMGWDRALSSVQTCSSVTGMTVLVACRSGRVFVGESLDRAVSLFGSVSEALVPSKRGAGDAVGATSLNSTCKAAWAWKNACGAYIDPIHSCIDCGVQPKCPCSASLGRRVYCHPRFMWTKPASDRAMPLFHHPRVCR